ncbi:maltose phosphorylase [Adhaeribacter aerolatus]|uniref:Maltose phosphorylase n=1 Tax=Adhaeribacter aerolatus TaxID=670289 RepID=A0A512AY94_9BACT|nr:family 65 glycosyl hydrolase domain-containing protein [Adhaeribacter aerolatus]GEO04686.1 maltose phosphorylase [Adhaeribacter aerolatus]
MERFLTINDWSIIEDGFHPEYNKITESVCSIANGRMGHRAAFEEKYSGNTDPSHYIAGIYNSVKDQACVQLNNLPEYTTQMVKAPNWIGIDVEVDGEVLDLATCKILDFRRELNMREGYLERTFRAQLPGGKEVEVSSLRFTSIADDELGAIRYAIMPLNFSGEITLTPYIDANHAAAEYNLQEKVWRDIDREVEPGAGFILSETEKTAFQVSTGMRLQLEKDGTGVETKVELINRDRYIANRLTAPVDEGEQLVLFKYAAVVSSEYYPPEKLALACNLALDRATQIGFAEMLDAQAAVWGEKWQDSDTVIKGDAAAQQAIRLNIFQLHQTYTGEDERLSISRNGFTGATYSGATYWDTEVFGLPFYLATAEPQVARNLLLYRYNLLPRAIENAQELGFTGGAALYPMGSLNGEECHTDKEIISSAIHRNGAVAFAIYDYIRYTGDTDYLQQFGLEVLIGISRFWAQRVNWSGKKNKYVLLEVTGPDEYARNVNNNWYTATIASWTLAYTLQALEQVKLTASTRYQELKETLNFDEAKETAQWQNIINNLYYPADEEKGIFLQHDNYLAKEPASVKDQAPNQQPLDQTCTEDRISPSSFIQPAEVLQGLFLFEENYDSDTIRRNFNFYESRAVHESALSAGIHAIVAAKIGHQEKAYEYFMRSARQDLDNLNDDTEAGCHITGMAGTWMAVVKGFGGMRVRNNHLHLHPVLPSTWQSFTFKIRFREHRLDITVSPSSVKILNQADKPLVFHLYGQEETIPANNISNFPSSPVPV